jgi:drug/metabolite transporter (DMT)-like permease
VGAGFSPHKEPFACIDAHALRGQGGGMLRVIIAMTVATASAALGQILLRRGMLQIGSLETYSPGALIFYFWHALCNPYVIAGTILNGAFYFLFMATLSWTDVTVALPMTAIEYAFAAILAILMLKESVSPIRWAGIALVILGVILVARGGGET